MKCNAILSMQPLEIHMPEYWENIARSSKKGGNVFMILALIQNNKYKREYKKKTAVSAAINWQEICGLRFNKFNPFVDFNIGFIDNRR